MEKLYRFRWDCGRQGYVEGVFAADDAEVEKAYGMRVWFGEILGKHSEVHGTLDREDVTTLTDDADFIAKAKAYSLVPTGHNPLTHLRCECGAMINEEECAEDCPRRSETSK